MQINGQIKVINDTQNISDKFSKREFVLTIDGTSQYPQHISMEFTQDKCSLLDKYQVGQDVSVDFNLRGREWNGPQGVKYFNTLQAWKIEGVNGAAAALEPIVNNSTQNSGHDSADLPF